MNFAKLSISPNTQLYHFKDSSNAEMCILGLFLSNDVWPNDTFFRGWALQSTDGDTVGGNCTILENENGLIILNDEYPVVADPAGLKMTVKQFIQLLDDWQEKVIKREPKEVIIKHEHGEFFIETSN